MRYVKIRRTITFELDCPIENWLDWSEEKIKKEELDAPHDQIFEELDWEMDKENSSLNFKSEVTFYGKEE